MATVTKPIALDESLNTTELSSRNVADVLAQELSAVATAIGGIAVPSADHVSYDNSVSGLSATDVQNALDEIVSDIPTVNNGTLTIQQNGTSKGSFTANSASNVNVNIETPTADKKTATDQFTTADGGLLSKCMIDLVPVQSGSGDPSPDNVRAISGHTSAELLREGKNFFDYSQTTESNFSNTNGTYTNTNTDTRTNFAFMVQALLNNTVVVQSSTLTISAVGRYYRTINITSEINKIRIKHNGLQRDLTIDMPFTRTGNVTISLDVESYNPSTNGGLVIKNIQIELGTTDSTFEPYLGHLYQVQIGSTVYGGYVDLVSGVMTVTGASVDLGSLSDTYYDSTKKRFVCPLSGAKTTGASDITTAISSVYKAVSFGNLYNNLDLDGVFAVSTQGSLSVRNLAYTDKNAFLTAMSGQTIVYPLATPITIQLTPQQIETLAGQNNLSTPLSGQSIETNGVEYKELFTFADVKSYVDKKIPDAPTTDGTYTLQAVVSGGVPTYSWT